MMKAPLAALFLCALVAACGGEAAPSDSAPQSGGSKVPASVFVDTAPDGAIDVNVALRDAKDGDSIVVRAVVGGRKKVFVDGRAVLVVADVGLVHCADEEGCPTPWDYCCETQETLLANTLTVQVSGEDGRPFPASLEGAGGLDELKPVVVAGTVRSKAGSFVLDAERIFVGG